MKRNGPPLLLLLVWLSGCGATPVLVGKVSHNGTAISANDTGELTRRWQKTNFGYHTLEAVHQVTIEIALGGGRSEKRSFRALLAVQRPGLFRVQLLGPMGLKLMDILYRSGSVQVLHLAEELRRSSRIGQLVADIAADIAAVFQLDPQPQPSRRTVEESVALVSGSAPLYEIREYQDSRLLRQLTIFAASLAISRVEMADERGGQRTITYGGYEHFGHLTVPRQIHLARDGAMNYWLAIQVESVTIDPKLDSRLFVDEGQRR